MEYSIKLNSVNNPEKNVRAFATLTFGDSFKVTNLAVLVNKENELFVSMPRFRSNERSERNEAVYKDVCHPITKEFHDELYGAILDTFAEMEKTGRKEVTRTAGFAAELGFSVKVTPYKREGSNILGLASIYLEDCFVVGNVSILKGKEKEFVAMPSYRTGQTDMKTGKPMYQDVCFPVTKTFREKLYSTLLDSYRQEKDMASMRQQAAARNEARSEFMKVDDKELPFR